MDLIKRVELLRATSRERKMEYLKKVRNFVRPMLNDDGSWNIELTEESGRLDMQLGTAFFCGNDSDAELANRLVMRTPIREFDGKRFDIFQTSIACHHLTVFKDRMETETISWCKQVIEEGLTSNPGMMCPDYQFQGYNDNMPAMAVKTLILGSELLDRGEFFEMGIWKLQRLAEQLSRCGLIGEYNSPNYTPDTIHNLTTLYRYTKSTECRELAEKIVKRIWLDLATHWHPSGKCQAGPFSRAYIHDFNNYISVLNCVVSMELGLVTSHIDPAEAISPRDGIEAMHSNDPLEHAARIAWYAVLDDSLLDNETAALFVAKPYPFTVIASAEQGDCGYTPLKKSIATTFMAENYTLGSTSFAFHGGQQTASLYATGVSENDNISSVLSFRYLVNDVYPGQQGSDDWHRRTSGLKEFYSRSTAVTVQHYNSAMASFVPHRQLDNEAISRLCLVVAAPCGVGQFGGFVDETGSKLVPDREYSVRQWFGARMGKGIAGIYPLAYSCLDLPDARVVLRQNAAYEYLEIINYSGESRCFTSQELALIMNGVMVEIAAAADWKSLAEFLLALKKSTRFEDQFVMNTRRLRVYRDALSDRESVSLILNYSTAFDGSAIRGVNGKNAPEPVWECTGISVETLPFLGKDCYIAPTGIPWDDLTVNWFPDTPWAINKSFPTA